MEKVIGIENLNLRKIKTKEYTKIAEECLFGGKKVVLDKSDFFDGNKFSEKIFDDSRVIYANPTEKLMIGDFVNEGDKFATVLSSGDFALDGVFHGAKEVATFDINKNQFLMAELKTKGVQKLSYDDFVAFFSDVSSDGYLSSEIYRKIKAGDSNNPMLAFWDVVVKVREQEKKQMAKYPEYKMFKEMNNLSKEDPKLFMSAVRSMSLHDMVNAIRNFNDVYFDMMMTRMNSTYKPSKIFDMIQGPAGKIIEGSYIESQDSFLETRERLKNSKISFLKSDLTKLKNNLLAANKIRLEEFKGFNSIYLSNIPEYMTGQAFFEVVNEQLMPLLTDDGSVIYCCQGVDSKLLEDANASEELQRLVNKRNDMGSLIAQIQEINDVEGYQALREKYDVSKTVIETYAPCNGFSNTDVFVRVKKK